MLKDRWIKCIELKGDYVEKQIGFLPKKLSKDLGSNPSIVESVFFSTEILLLNNYPIDLFNKKIEKRITHLNTRDRRTLYIREEESNNKKSARFAGTFSSRPSRAARFARKFERA